MAKVTSKLQITLPKRIAEQHGIEPGDEIRFESTGHAIRILPAKAAEHATLSKAERLRLFDETTRRLEQREAVLPVANAERTERDWQRADLYARGTPR